MRSLVLMSATALVLGLGTATASAAPMQRLGTGVSSPTVTLVDGWWERENHDDAAGRYWQLPPRDRKRYDATEARILKRHHHHLDQYDHHDDKDLATEHRLLRYQ